MVNHDYATTMMMMMTVTLRLQAYITGSTL